MTGEVIELAAAWPPRLFSPEHTENLAALPFVRQRARGPKEGLAYDMWTVEPIGDYDIDYHTGRQLAHTYLEFLGRGRRLPLSVIVKAMPRAHTGVEDGFLATVMDAAIVGAILSAAVQRDPPAS